MNKYEVKLVQILLIIITVSFNLINFILLIIIINNYY